MHTNNSTSLSNNFNPTLLSPVIPPALNTGNTNPLPVQQIVNTSPEIQVGLAQAEGNIPVIQAVSQKEQSTLDDAALAVAQDGTKDENERMQAAKSIINDAKRDDAYLAIAKDYQDDSDISTQIRFQAAQAISDQTPSGQDKKNQALFSVATQGGDSDVGNYDIRKKAAKLISDPKMGEEVYLGILRYTLDATVEINKLIDTEPSDFNEQEPEPATRLGCAIWIVSKIKNSHIKDIVILEICKNWPALERTENSEDSEDSNDSGSYDVFSANINLFNHLYSFASSENMKAKLIKTIADNTALDKEFREQIIDDHAEDLSEKDLLLTSLEEGRSIQGSNTKRAQ